MTPTGTVQSRVVGLEIAVSCTPSEAGAPSPCQPDAPTGTLEVGPVQAFHLNDAPPPPPADEPPDDPELAASIAALMLSRQAACPPLVAAWCAEPTAQCSSGAPDQAARDLNAYGQAMALLTLAWHADLTGDPATVEGAEALADALVALQHQAPTNGTPQVPKGLWCDQLPDGGCGALGADDTCGLWVGSSAWVGIALLEARRLLPKGEAGAWDQPIQAAVDAVAALAGFGGEPAGGELGSVTAGAEGQLSATLFVHLAAEEGFQAPPGALDAMMASVEALVDPVFDRLKMGKDDWRWAIDVVGSWGPAYWDRIGKHERAAKGRRWAWTLFRGTSYDGEVRGLIDILGATMTPMTEFTAQAASAGAPGASYALSQMLPAVTEGGAVAGSLDAAVAGGAWAPGMSWGTAPAAWVYAALRHPGFPGEL